MARTPISTIAQFAPCTINIRGKVAFSRLSSRIEGQELAEQNQKAMQSGRPQHAKPYVFITIDNPVIIDNANKINPQVKSVISERFFTKKDGTVAFTQESKSPYLPTVLYGPESGELAGQGIADSNVPLQSELATGLDVTVGVDLFVMKGAYNNVGLGIKYILVNEPVRYFSRNSFDADLASMGITYSAPVATAQPIAPATPQQPTFTQPAVPQGYTQPPQPTFTQPVQSAPWDDEDIPFNKPQVPAQQFPGATPQTTKPVRYY